jgi:hypothetical protein
MNQTLRDRLVDLSGTVQGADLHDRVLRGSRRITLRNRAIGSLATVVVLVGAILAFNAVRPGNEVQPPTNTPTPSATASPPSTASPSPSPTASAGIDLRNATFEVPAFPDTQECGKGQRTFTNGVAPVKQNVDLLINSMVAPVMANVDGVPGDEVIVALICRFDSWAQEEVIALKVAGQGQYSPLGFALGTSHITLVTWEPMQVVAGTVYLELTSQCNEACPNSEQQRRGFTWQGGSFKQVSGPDKFVGIPAVTAIDFRNTTLQLFGIPVGGKQWSGSVRTVNGTGKGHFADSYPPSTTMEFTVTVGSTKLGHITQPGLEPDVAFVVLTLQTPNGQTTVLGAFEKGQASPNGPANAYAVVTAGDGGVTAIGNVDAGTADRVTVTVTTASGQESRTYRHGQGGWERVS